MCCQPTESNRVFTALVRLQTDVHILQTPYTVQQAIGILGRKGRPRVEAVSALRKAVLQVKLQLPPKKLQYLKYCWEHQRNALWLCKSCPILGTSISINPYILRHSNNSSIPEEQSSQRTKPLLENHQRIYSFSKGV